MPLDIKITLGADSFEAKGDVSFDEGFQTAFRSWLNATGATGAVTLEQLAERSEQQSEELQRAVDASQVPKENGG